MSSKPSGDNLPLNTVNGVLVPRFVQQKYVDDLKSLELYSDDVWIVTYPKCGTTWTQQIVKLIRNNGVNDGVKIILSSPWLEARATFPHLKIEDVPRPRSFKSHFSYDTFPCGPPRSTPCKYIYVARNPKDMAVSYFFHTKKGFLPDLTWESFWELFLIGKMGFGDYFDHVLSWWPHRDDKNVLFLKYEDMKKNPKEVISQIARFIRVDNLSQDIVTKIAESTSFEKMKADDTANMSWLHFFNDETGKPSFLRKGIIGDWKNFLTEEQSAQIDALCDEKLKGLGIEFDYE